MYILFFRSFQEHFGFENYYHFHYSTNINRSKLHFQWDDDVVRFVLDQHAELDFYSAYSLKQQSAGRHVAPLRHIIMIVNLPVFALTPLWRSNKYKFKLDFNKHDINIFINDMWQKYVGNSSKLHGDLNFAFDQRWSKVNLHKATSSPESPSNVSPDWQKIFGRQSGNYSGNSGHPDQC
jgi:hypothetical protein